MNDEQVFLTPNASWDRKYEAPGRLRTDAALTGRRFKNVRVLSFFSDLQEPSIIENLRAIARRTDGKIIIEMVDRL